MMNKMDNKARVGLEDPNTWDYRIVHRVLEGRSTWGIYEVYYNRKGTPMYCTEEPVEVVGGSLQELLVELDRYCKARTRPALEYNDLRPPSNNRTKDGPGG